MGDSILSATVKSRTLYRLTQPTKTLWLVAHNGKDCAHVVELPQGCECLTGLGTLEKCADEKSAKKRAAEFGWKAPVETHGLPGETPPPALGTDLEYVKLDE